jgi:hypothetical protein
MPYLVDVEVAQEGPVALLGLRFKIRLQFQVACGGAQRRALLRTNGAFERLCHSSRQTFPFLSQVQLVHELGGLHQQTDCLPISIRKRRRILLEELHVQGCASMCYDVMSAVRENEQPGC